MNVKQLQYLTYDDYHSLNSQYQGFRKSRANVFEMMYMSQKERDKYMHYLIQYKEMLERSINKLRKRPDHMDYDTKLENRLLADFHEYLCVAKQINKRTLRYSKLSYFVYKLLRKLRLKRGYTLVFE